MTQPTPIGLLKVLGQVTLIVAIPMLGGAVAGMLLDRMQGTSPLFVLSGFVVGNLVAIVGIWLYIRVQRQKVAAGGEDRADER
ncbi:MAG TPA: AtpZ/AtpI family protein [Candidatus Limnocylindria bacterium]|nr:AtpZ/AtpI family protein [Candidatus Limnocylindria bacterium]